METWNRRVNRRKPLKGKDLRVQPGFWNRLEWLESAGSIPRFQLFPGLDLDP